MNKRGNLKKIIINIYRHYSEHNARLFLFYVKIMLIIYSMILYLYNIFKKIAYTDSVCLINKRLNLT